MKIYLIRHGQTTGDIENRYGGAYDDHLTEKGETEALQAGQRLKNKNIEHIYVSPKIRTQEAAALINQSLNLPITTLTGIEERDAGLLNGMDKNEARQKYPELVEHVKNIYYTLPEGESYEHLKTRVLEAFNSVTENSPYKTILIVTHGGPMKLIYRELFNKGELGETGDYCVLELEKTNDLKFINYTNI